MYGREIRQKYIDFFVSKEHLHLPSDSLAPDDPSLLFTSAGMVQFKPYFMGVEKPPKPRAVTAQKCLRTDDIEEVGDLVHHTFFEMMGNFSFGDYFKREAIHFAWEFMTKWLKLPEDRLWTSVYLDDDEAATVWENEIGLPSGRIVRLGEDKNYWPANAPSKGPNGPCGPCNEIFLDMSPQLGAPEDPAAAIAYDSNRFVEIWNLVFMQFERSEGGELSPLPSRNIDTGLGLERVAAIMQGVASAYETDLFAPLVRQIEQVTGARYGSDPETDIAIRTVADHVRGAVFCIADGIMPSNVKRGYVLRRMIRRAALKARNLGFQGQFIAGLAPAVAEMMGDWYREIPERLSLIQNVLGNEEAKFARTLATGLGRIDEEIRAAKAAGAGKLGGESAFMLYDTYGFPLEITEELCKAEGLDLDREGFRQQMEQQRERGRKGSDIAKDLFAGADAAVTAASAKAGPTDFVGYDSFDSHTEIKALIAGGDLAQSAEEGESVQILLGKSPFYAESGGQVGDSGVISTETGSAAVSATRKAGEVWLHEAMVTSGEISVGQEALASVDPARRMSIMRNHTATHLLHAALRKHLGDHVAQAGSLVAPDRLRFDFSHFQSMSPDDLRRVEDEINHHVLEDLPVSKEWTSLEQAREKGAMALFGEKYGDTVRTVTIPSVSMELCGGTHLDRTSEIGLLKIVSESSVAAGVRRIEALTGTGALDYVRRLEERLEQAAERLQTSAGEIVTAIERLQAQIAEQQEMLDAAKSRSAADEADQLLSKAVAVQGFQVICSRTGLSDADAMSDLADRLADKLGSAVIVLGSEADGKVLFVCKVTKDLVGKGLNAGNIVREVAKAAGGGGGGRPEFAKAGGKDPEKLDGALELALALIRESASN